MIHKKNRIKGILENILDQSLNAHRKNGVTLESIEYQSILTIFYREIKSIN